MLSTIQESSVQSRATDDNDVGGGIFHILLQANEIIPPWWSRSRDTALRNYWKKSDHLSGAMYSFISKIKSIPFRVTPRNSTIKNHGLSAHKWQDKLLLTSDLGNGWLPFISKWIEDYVGTDNGAFAEIIGPGRPDGPITGEVLGIANLDSRNCTRTRSAEYPVVYYDPRDGSRHKLHRTRVMFASQVPSADEDMNGVGFCSISRAINTAQNLIDISIYNQEKLGSRPNRGLVLVGGGLDPEYVTNSLQIANNIADAKGFQRYRPMTVIGDADVEAPTVNIVDTNSIPDGFNFRESLELGMAVIALAFGVDARELFPASGTGATRADALIQHIKQRGKGPGDAINTLEQLLNTKVLPPYLQFEFDYQDDAQDRQEAEINRIRSQSRKSNIEMMVTTVRIERERMVESGEISEWQFAQMELAEGRLPDGSPALSLFGSRDPFFVVGLSLEGVSNPFDTTNDYAMVMRAIEKRRIELVQLLVSENSTVVMKTHQAIAALDELKKLYKPVSDMVIDVTPDEMDEQPDSVLSFTDDEENLMADTLNVS